MLAGIRNYVLITTKQDQDSFKRLLGDGGHLGIHLNYKVQASPAGIAQAFEISSEHIEGKKVSLILGDNIFHGPSLGKDLGKFANIKGANIFGYQVSNPFDYGVAECDSNGNVISIEEKPKQPKSNIAIPGLYFYDEDVLHYSQNLKPSERGELEITDLNRQYLKEGKLKINLLPRGTAWLDTGTFQNLHDASSYIKAIEERQGLMVSCVEEIAYRNGWISENSVLERAKFIGNGDYAKYLKQIISLTA